jgi:hypothetical protein
LIGFCFVDIANAGWANALEELLGKASGKAVKVVDEVPIPKHGPDVAPLPKPSFEAVPAIEANFNAGIQVARFVSKCKEQGESSEWQRNCEKKGEEMKLCLNSEAKSGSKDQLEKKCGLVAKNKQLPILLNRQ